MCVRVHTHRCDGSEGQRRRHGSSRKATGYTPYQAIATGRQEPVPIAVPFQVHHRVFVKVAAKRQRQGAGASPQMVASPWFRLRPKATYRVARLFPARGSQNFNGCCVSLLPEAMRAAAAMPGHVRKPARADRGRSRSMEATLMWVPINTPHVGTVPSQHLRNTTNTQDHKQTQSSHNICAAGAHA